MSVLRPRNRIVYFRVSEDEFHRFHDICQSTGARSISDLARFAMQSLIQDGASDRPPQVFDKLTSLETMVNDLNRKINLLTESLGKSYSHEALSRKVPELGSQENEIRNTR